MWRASCSCGWSCEVEQFVSARRRGENHVYFYGHTGQVVLCRAGDEGFYRVFIWGTQRFAGSRRRWFALGEPALKKSA